MTEPLPPHAAQAPLHIGAATASTNDLLDLLTRPPGSPRTPGGHCPTRAAQRSLNPPSQMPQLSATTLGTRVNRCERPDPEHRAGRQPSATPGSRAPGRRRRTDRGTAAIHAPARLRPELGSRPSPARLGTEPSRLDRLSRAAPSTCWSSCVTPPPAPPGSTTPCPLPGGSYSTPDRLIGALDPASPDNV